MTHQSANFWEEKRRKPVKPRTKEIKDRTTKPETIWKKKRQEEKNGRYNDAT